ncbi:unnamed protein product [Litomosoides sigmodontis]|uniref:Uncharacterized protein n=1 Tax=Litomosoides sigmodontis TaxID=42156 RepID=A0A3P6TL69_LITSI|nr:unnamed protein product [Litomosoides sigmodontis]
MKQRQRKQFGSAGNLAVKGVGYMSYNNTSCHKLQNTLSSTTTMQQRGVAHRPTSTSSTAITTKKQTTLRKSGSIGNIRNVFTSSTPSVKNISKEKHSAGKESRKDDKNDDSYHSDTSLPPSVTMNSDVLGEGEAPRVDIPDDDKEKPWRVRKRVSYAEPEVTEASIPSNNYGIKSSSCTTDQADLLHKLEESYQVRFVALINILQYVSYVFRGSYRIKVDNVILSMGDILSNLIAKLKLVQRERRLEERLKQKTTEIERIAYENIQLSDYIEELNAKSKRNEENFARDKRALMEEAVELQRRLDYLTPALADKESYVAKMELEKDELADKLRHATNQLSEVQITIDEKNREERILFDVEEEQKNEIDRLLKTIQHLENMLKDMKNKEASLINDITSMKRSLREEQLTAKKDKAVAEKTLEENNALIKENSHLSAEITRLEMRMRTLNQQIDHEQEKELKPTEIASMRELEKSLKMELLKAEERLQMEKERGRRTILELEQYRKAEEGSRESRGRVQRELDALKALSESLSNENKSLRHEKFILAERCEELLKKGNSLTDNVMSLTANIERLKETNLDIQRKMNEKEEELEHLQEQNRDLMRKVKDIENELQKYKEHYDNIERKYKETFEELGKQTVMRQEKSEEYEKLAKRVLELSDSVKDKQLSPPSAASRPSVMLTPWSDKCFPDQYLEIFQSFINPESSAAAQQTSKRIQTNERRVL